MLWFNWEFWQPTLSSSPSSPAQPPDYLICPAVLPATITKRTSCTEATVSPALPPEILDQRWTGIQSRSPSPAAAAAAALLRRMRRSSALRLKVEGKTRTRDRSGRASLKQRCRPTPRIRPPPPFCSRGPHLVPVLWSPPSTCGCCLRNTPATPSASSNCTRRKRRTQSVICLPRRAGHTLRRSSTSCHTPNNSISTHTRCFPSTPPSSQLRVKGHCLSAALLCCTGQRPTGGLSLRMQLRHIWARRFHSSAGAATTGCCLLLGTRTKTVRNSSAALRWRTQLLKRGNMPGCLCWV